MSAIVLLAGLQMLTVGARPLPVVKRLAWERHFERRRRGAYPAEGLFRVLVLGALIGTLLGQLTFR